VLHAPFLQLVDKPQETDYAQHFISPQANFAKRGARVVGSTPEQMGRFVREETARWAQVIQVAKITVD